MMPLQKLEKSCKKTNCVMTMIARFLERTVIASSTGDTSGNVSAGDAALSSSGEGTGKRVSIAPDLDSSVSSSTAVDVIVAISRTGEKVQNMIESGNID
jgi:hypothetical protein